MVLVVLSWAGEVYAQAPLGAGGADPWQTIAFELLKLLGAVLLGGGSVLGLQRARERGRPGSDLLLEGVRERLDGMATDVSLTREDLDQLLVVARSLESTISSIVELARDGPKDPDGLPRLPQIQRQMEQIREVERQHLEATRRQITLLEQIAARQSPAS